MTDADLIEALADTQHEIWSHWMKYLFGVSRRNGDGSVTIPADKVERWKRQMATAYAELTDHEQDSDRHQAQKIMDVLGEPLHTVDLPLEELRIIIDAMTEWAQPPMPEFDATVHVACVLEQLEAQYKASLSFPTVTEEQP